MPDTLAPAPNGAASDDPPSDWPEGAVLDERGFYRMGWQKTVGWVLACPECDLKGTPEFFSESCAGECFCPVCGRTWEFDQ